MSLTTATTVATTAAINVAYAKYTPVVQTTLIAESTTAEATFHIPHIPHTLSHSTLYILHAQSLSPRKATQN